MFKWNLEARLLILSGLLFGCSSNTVPIVQNIYPSLPDVPALSPIDLKPVKVELPTPSSFVGIDYKNWVNLQINLQTFKQRELTYIQRIEEVNKQRHQWNKLNEVKNASDN